MTTAISTILNHDGVDRTVVTPGGYLSDMIVVNLMRRVYL